MKLLLAVTSVLLALVVAGIVAYIAWQVVRQAEGDDDTGPRN